jgi:hypothetical protein
MMKNDDMVDHPPHYQSDTGVECIDAIRAALGPEGFRAHCRGTAIKYLWREKWDNCEDLKKAAWYLERLIKSYETDAE